MADRPPIAELYRTLLRSYGPQGWWPAEGAFEMMIGAILIQHTAWNNAEKALDNLRAAGLFDARRLKKISRTRLTNMIRPAGMFNVKADRIKHFLSWYQSQGEIEALQKLPTPTLRKKLLTVKGIGRETADDILVYAFHRPVFVVDAYTRRIFQRLGLSPDDENDEDLRARVESVMPEDALKLGEFHALLVAHAKAACRSRPSCEACCLRHSCARNFVR